MPRACLHLGDDLVGPGDRQVDLVEHRHDGQVVLHRQIGVGDGLGLHALEGIDQQDGALAGGEAARDLVAEIDVAGRVDQVQLVDLAVGVRVVDRDRVHLDGDAAFAFEVHGVEELGAEIALGDGPGLEQELVGQRALAVVDVGDDREVADEARRGHRVSRRVEEAVSPTRIVAPRANRGEPTRGLVSNDLDGYN